MIELNCTVEMEKEWKHYIICKQNFSLICFIIFFYVHNFFFLILI